MLSSSELKQFQNKPVTKIAIPGLTFSDITATRDESGNTYFEIPFLGEYIATMYKFAIAVMSIIAVVVIIVAGLRMTMSGGDASAMQAGKESIGKALIGLLLAVGSYTILYSVNPELVAFKNLRVKYVEPESLEDVEREFASTGGLEGEAEIGTCVNSYTAPTPGKQAAVNSSQYVHYAVMWGFRQQKTIMENIKEVDIVDVWGTDFSGSSIKGRNYLNNQSFAKNVRRENPRAKILISLVRLYKGDVNKTVLRQNGSYDANVKYAVAMIRKYDLDGISINFEFPSPKTNPKVTEDDTTKFFQDFRRDVERQVNKRIILSFYAPNSTRYAVNFEEVAAEVDYLTPMTYGIYRTKDKFAGPYQPLFHGKPFSKRYTLKAFLESLNSKIPQRHWNKIIITTGAWPATIFSNTATDQPGTTFESAKYKSHPTLRKTVRGKKVCLHPSGSKYAHEGKTQYWFEDYDTFKLKIGWARQQILAGKMGGFYEWSTNLMDDHYWAAIYDVF